MDVAKRYQAMRNREGMAWAERMQEEARVAGSGVELNKWLSEGPVILSESLAPAAAVAVDPDTTQSMRRQAPRAGAGARRAEERQRRPTWIGSGASGIVT